jgi:hypothetical protein
LLSSNLKIGYSCWGFLGDGITDTPDGGRSHRLTLLKALIDEGSSIIMLQKDRDLNENHIDYSNRNLTFNTGFPNIDLLFLEYRWPIVGRNSSISKNEPTYTPDLDRQIELIIHYGEQGLPIFIWDKDQKLTQEEESRLKKLYKIKVFEPALKPKKGRHSLFFPIDEGHLTTTLSSIDFYDISKRKNNLIYIGNQYERDSSFYKYIELPSKLSTTKAEVYGKWETKSIDGKYKYMNVNFHGRINFSQVNKLYESAIATVLLAPKQYYSSGQYTQRLFEALWGLCIPLVPYEYKYKKLIFPDILFIKSSQDVNDKIDYIKRLKPLDLINLIKQIFNRLELFSPKTQVKIILSEFNKLKN